MKVHYEAEVPATTITVHCLKHNSNLRIEDEQGASGQLSLYVETCEDCVDDALELKYEN